MVKALVVFLLIFAFYRLMFLLHQSDKFADVGFGEIAFGFLKAFRLDLATACFLTVFPAIIYGLAYFTRLRFLEYAYKGVYILLVILVLIIHSGEIVAYSEWNHKLSTRVFNHLANPDEVGRTAGFAFTFLFLLYFVLGLVLFYKLSLWFRLRLMPERGNWKRELGKGVLFVLVLPFFMLGARGGVQQIPINIDAAYYSEHVVCNDLSVNSTYFLAKNFMLYQRGSLDKELPQVDLEEANHFMAYLYEPTELGPELLKNKRPNIVLLVMESWSGNAIGCMNDWVGVTPYFDSLASQGFLFDSLYATGGTSDVGNGSIFAGMPAIPEIFITQQPDKHRQLNTINQDLKKLGYSSSYLFGGDLRYGNIGGLFQDHSFDHVRDEKSFPASVPKGKLSVHDEDLYRYFEMYIRDTKEPFLQCAFTGSTHSPYDFPKKKDYGITGPDADFMTSMAYADEELYAFMERAKKEKWYKNTLFILVADHGHSTPKQNNPCFTNFYRIPLLFFGEPLKEEYQGKRCSTIGAQSDLIATLFAQMDLSSQKYPWSRNLLSPSAKNFAFIASPRGYGYVTPKGGLVHHFDFDRLLDNHYPTKEMGLKKQHEAELIFRGLYEYFQKL
jgi:phosphoglycerol transferase MdoB-like AlkP superfamily enzyme